MAPKLNLPIGQEWQIKQAKTSAIHELGVAPYIVVVIQLLRSPHSAMLTTYETPIEILCKLAQGATSPANPMLVAAMMAKAPLAGVLLLSS